MTTDVGNGKACSSLCHSDRKFRVTNRNEAMRNWCIFNCHGVGGDEVWICLHVRRNLGLDLPCFEILVLLTYQTARCCYAWDRSLLAYAIVWISARVFSLSVVNKTHFYYRYTS
jgi:hypothetical protein